ncbi:MAG TPA: type II toxin-antitoxin system RelE/ParE family toxin [Caulifigura sp.]|jgi:plasmid stabilization system protein ParE|nr:type II toxin-antitoxin system RelE/ParE family toxin [Caulifigura sp.]
MRRAKNDLHRIEDYSQRQWGSRTADEYIQQFQDALDRLRQNPELLRAEPDFSAEYLLYRVDKYWIVCDYVDRVIYVLTILHTSMDVAGRLLELEPTLEAEVRLLRGRIGG